MSQPCEDARSKTPLTRVSHQRGLCVWLVASGVSCQVRDDSARKRLKYFGPPQSRSHARFNGFGQGDLWTRTHR